MTPPGSKDCTCRWPELCDGTGQLQCLLDNCVCTCGGIRECPGCDMCADLDDKAAPA